MFQIPVGNNEPAQFVVDDLEASDFSPYAFGIETQAAPQGKRKALRVVHLLCPIIDN